MIGRRVSSVASCPGGNFIVIVEEGFHALGSDRLCEGFEGSLICVEQIILDRRCSGVVDDFKRPLRIMFEPIDENADGNAISANGSGQGGLDDCGIGVGHGDLQEQSRDDMSGRERPIDRCPPDLEPSGDRGGAEPLVAKFPHLVWINRRRAPLIYALQFRGLNAPALPGFDEVLLDGPDQAEQRQHDFGHEVGPVEHDFGIVDAKDGALLDDPLGDRQQIAGIASEAVWMQGQEFRAGLQEAEGRFELMATIELRTIGGVMENDHSAKLFQPGLLGRDILAVVRAHPGVAQHSSHPRALVSYGSKTLKSLLYYTRK